MTLSIAPLTASLVAQTMPSGPVSIATAFANVANYRSGTIAIQDTADNIALNLDALQKVNSRISGISFSSDASTLALTVKQISSDSAVLGKINGDNYSLTAQSALVADVSRLLLNGHVTAIEVQDSSRNIAASLTALSASNVAAKVTSIRQTGTPADLAITAAQLLDTANAATLNKIADNYTLNVSGVSLADMTTVSGNVKVAGISILDSTDQIASHLDDLRLLGVRLVSAKAIDHASLTLSATQVKTDAWVLGKIYGGYELAVQGASLSDVADLSGNSRVKSVNVIDSAVNIIKNIDLLKRLGSHLGSITLTDASTPLALTASVFTKNATLLGKIDNTETSFAVSEASYANLASLLATGSKVATVAVSDTAVNIASHLDALQALGNQLTSVTRIGASNVMTIAANQLTIDSEVLGKMANSFSLAVTGVLAGAASDIAATSNVGSIKVSDTSDQIALKWGELNVLGPKLTQITQTGTAATMAISATQLSQMGSTLAKINGAYTLNVSSVLASDAVKTAANSHVTSMTVSDSAANISANLDALNALGSKITAIAQSDGLTALNITATQLTADSAALDKLGQVYNLAVSNVYASDAFRVANLDHVATVSVNDTSGNIAYSLDVLQDLTLTDKLTSITSWGSAVPLAITATQLNRDAVALGKLTGSYGLAVRGVTAVQASSVAASAHVTSVAVSDTSAEIAGNLTSLKSLGKQLTTITQTTVTPLSLSAAQLVSNIGVLAKITNGFSLNVLGVSAANAANVAAQRNVASIAVEDTSANIAAKLDILTQLNTRISGITQTVKQDLNITADQMTADAAMLAKIDGGAYTLAVSNVRAANVATIAANTHVTTFAVADSADNLVGNLAALKSALTVAVAGSTDPVNKLGSITQVGNAPLTITAGQLSDYYTSVLSKIGNNYSLAVSAVTADNASTVAGMAHVNSVAVADSSSNIATNLDALTGLGKELVSVTQTTNIAPLQITADQLVADKSALNKITNGYTLAVRNVTAQNAQAVANNANVASMAITDTSSNIALKLDILQQLNGKISTLTRTDAAGVMKVTGDQYILNAAVLAKITTGYNLNVSNVKASNAGTVGADSHVTSLNVSDTSANISSYLDNLLSANGKLGTVFQTGVPSPISLTHAQLTANGAVLNKISNSYSLAVTSILAGSASAVATTAHVATVAVSDSSLNIKTNLDTLQSLGAKLSSITQTGTATTMAITADQYINNNAALGKISNSYTLSVSGVSAASATTVGNNNRVLSLSVTDSSDSIVRNLDALQSLGAQLTSITQTTPTSPLAITAAQLSANGAALSKISNAFTMNVRNVPVDFAAAIAITTNVATISVTDTAENLSRKIDSLQALASKLASVTVSDNSNPLALTATQWAANASVLGKITNGYSVSISDITAASAVGLAGNAHVSAMSVLDTSANIATQLDGLQSLGRQLTDIRQSGAASPLSISTTQWTSDAAAIGKIRNAYSLNVTGVSAGNAVNVAAQANVASVEVTDTSDNIAKNWDAMAQIGAQLNKITSSNVATSMAITATQLASDAAALSKVQGNYLLDVTNVAAANASAINGMSHVASFSVLDEAEHVNANLDALDGMLKLNTITNTTTTPINVTAAQWANDADTIGKISNNIYSVTVSGVDAAAATGLATGHVVSVSVADTTDNILTSLGDLQAMGSKLTGITQTTASTIDITAAQLYANAPTFAKFNDSYSLRVSGVAADDALTVSRLAGVSNMDISDTSANIATHLDDLQSLGTRVTALTQTGVAAPLAITAAQWRTDATALSHLDTHTLWVRAVSLDQLAAISADTQVTQIDISDTSANIASKLSDLMALGSRLHSVIQTDVITPMSVTATQMTSAASVWAKFSNAYSLNVSDVLATDVGTVNVRSDVSAFSVKDNGANIQSGLTALFSTAAGANSKLVNVTQTDVNLTQLDGSSTALNLTYGQWNPADSLWGTFTDVKVAVTGVSATNASTVAGQAHVSQVSVSDTRANIQNNWNYLQSVNAKLNGVAVTDDGALTITARQVVADAAVLSKLSGTYSLSVTDALVSDAMSLQGMTTVSSFAIKDTANNIANDFSRLNALTKISSIAPSDNLPIQLTQDLYNDNAVARGKISNLYSVTVG